MKERDIAVWLVAFVSIVMNVFIMKLLMHENCRRAKFEQGFEASQDALNYIEHNVLTKKQKWKVAHALESKQASAAK